MFDKLIESNSEEAEFKPRRKFFMVSSVVVGILFLSAVVFSLYAQDIDLGTDNFELVEVLAPVEADVPEPKPPRQQPQQTNQSQQTELPTRNDLIATIDQTPTAPTTISTTRFTGKTLPYYGAVNLSAGPETDGYGPVGPSENSGLGDSSAGTTVAEVIKLPEPPPVAAKPEPKRPIVKSEGVINGKATYLPPPPYPITAKTVGAYGVVNVQVTIDENGKVISSKAVSGHALLRANAEAAAWKAKFSPTLLSKVPVKVTGVIVYNFKQS